MAAYRSRCWSGRDQGFHGNAVNKAELLSQTLLYQTLHARWNENDIHHFLKTVSFLQIYSDIKTLALGFDFETCIAQPGSLLPYFCDITNTGKQLCSPRKPFVVVLEKGFFLNEISPFGVDFEICNFVNLFMPKHTHYTLTKIQKVKSIIGPLKVKVFFF